MEQLQQRQKTANANLNRFTVFLMKGNLWHVRLLQMLVGGSWNSATHVIYAINDYSYEITTEGLVSGQRDTAALYRACLDAHTFIITDEQAELIKGYLTESKDNKFDWLDCVRYCWHLLVGGFGCVFSFCDLLPLYGSSCKVQPYELVYFPPFTCTAPMWDLLEYQPPAWNCFTPAHLQQTLTGDLKTLEVED